MFVFPVYKLFILLWENKKYYVYYFWHFFIAPSLVIVIDKVLIILYVLDLCSNSISDSMFNKKEIRERSYVQFVIVFIDVHLTVSS